MIILYEHTNRILVILSIFILNRLLNTSQNKLFFILSYSMSFIINEYLLVTKYF